MTFTRRLLTACLGSVLLCASLNAQQPSSQSSAVVVPRLVNYSGKAVDEQGKTIIGIAGATFAIYKTQDGGSALWMETQNVTADKVGHFTVQLGAGNSEGLPLDLFASAEARWLGVSVNGAQEQPRVLLVSVPYALKAADAETLGGKPASAFMASDGLGAHGQLEKPKAELKNQIICSSATACKTSFVPLFSSNGGSAKVTDSIVTQNGTAVSIAGSESATGNISSGGNLSAAGSVNASGNLSANGTVSGSNMTATSSGGVAMRGENHGTGGGSDGVDGIAHGPASGVAGINDSASGVGVWGQSPGWSFYSAGNTSQARSAGGWVKAMVYINGSQPPYKILACYNSTITGAAATTPPCGFNYLEVEPGWFIIDFGFDVHDRFFSATQECCLATPPLSISRDSNLVNRITILAYDGSNTIPFDADVIVY